MIKEVNKQGIRKLEKKRKKKGGQEWAGSMYRVQVSAWLQDQDAVIQNEGIYPNEDRNVNKLNLAATRNINIEFLFC